MSTDTADERDVMLRLLYAIGNRPQSVPRFRLLPAQQHLLAEGYAVQDPGSREWALTPKGRAWLEGT